MKKDRLILSEYGIEEFYKTVCENEERAFSKKELKQFIEWCERDIYEWMNENWRTFSEDRDCGADAP